MKWNISELIKHRETNQNNHNRQTSNKSSHGISICECVRSIINFHPGNQDVDFDMLELFISFQ